ncbi:hypothetical protein GCM10027570_44530 [Streptomonospora sediminis]
MSESHGDHTELLAGDDELLARVRQGDTGAFEELYVRHADAARGLARQLVRSESEVDDAVAEAFARLLAVLGRGGGPADGFRPYLLTALRHVVYDRFRGEKRQVVTDDMEKFDSGEPFVDPALAGLERSLIARAYLSLPERWQAVLWYTEIEGVKPAEAAPSLGMNPNSVAALAYRAREGLRQAYLQMHLAGGAAESCRPAIGLLGAYVRDGLAKRDTATVDRHLDECGHCSEVYAELMDVNVGLRGIVLPLVAGPGAAGYLAAAGGVPVGFGGWWDRLPKRGQQAVAGGTAVAAAAAAVAFALVSNDEPLDPQRPSAPPAAAAPPAPPPPPPEPPAQEEPPAAPAEPRPQPQPAGDPPPPVSQDPAEPERRADSPPPEPPPAEVPESPAPPPPPPPSEPAEPPPPPPPPEPEPEPEPDVSVHVGPDGVWVHTPGVDVGVGVRGQGPPGAGGPPAAGPGPVPPPADGPGPVPPEPPGPPGPPGPPDPPGPPEGGPGAAAGPAASAVAGGAVALAPRRPPGPLRRRLRAARNPRSKAPLGPPAVAYDTRLAWIDSAGGGKRGWQGGVQTSTDLVRLLRGLSIGPVPNAGRARCVDPTPGDQPTGRGGVAWIAARCS